MRPPLSRAGRLDPSLSLGRFVDRRGHRSHDLKPRNTTVVDATHPNDPRAFVNLATRVRSDANVAERPCREPARKRDLHPRRADVHHLCFTLERRQDLHLRISGPALRAPAFLVGGGRAYLGVLPWRGSLRFSFFWPGAHYAVGRVESHASWTTMMTTPGSDVDKVAAEREGLHRGETNSLHHSTRDKPAQSRRSMIVTFAWPPPSHMVCSP